MGKELEIHWHPDLGQLDLGRLPNIPELRRAGIEPVDGRDLLSSITSLTASGLKHGEYSRYKNIEDIILLAQFS